MLDTVLGALAADPLVRSVRLGGSRARGEADEAELRAARAHRDAASAVGKAAEAR